MVYGLPLPSRHATSSEYMEHLEKNILSELGMVDIFLEIFEES